MGQAIYFSIGLLRGLKQGQWGTSLPCLLSAPKLAWFSHAQRDPAIESAMDSYAMIPAQPSSINFLTITLLHAINFSFGLKPRSGLALSTHEIDCPLQTEEHAIHDFGSRKTSRA